YLKLKILFLRTRFNLKFAVESLLQTEMPANIGTFSYFCPYLSYAMFAAKILGVHQSLLAFRLWQRIQLQNLSLNIEYNYNKRK
ncbi:MAG: hypothetical protein RLZZ546_2302, partial [Bacteroidota bacterium]